MSLEAMLTARAMDEGRALRTAGAAAPPAARRAAADRRLAVRRRAVHGRRARLRPAGGPDELCVPGFPINRDLLFRALQPFAEAFNAYFELPYEQREEVTRGTRTIERATTIPQLVVPNVATVALLGRLGRRLAYLPTDGERPADPALVRLGRHLASSRRRAQFPASN